MATFICLVGNAPALAFEELSSFIPNTKKITDACIQVETNDWDARTLMDILGGTVTIGQRVGEAPELTPIAVSAILANDPDFKGTFGLSIYGYTAYPAASFFNDIKTLLSQSRSHVRFILPKQGKTLTTVVVKKQRVYELSFIPTAGGFIIAKTLEVQDFEAWNRRDYGRPCIDAKKGMLPLKVARMVVNIGLGERAVGKVLLDPFCGMGTIVAEAGIRGASIVASDIDRETVVKAEKNIKWLFKDKPVKRNFIVSDATHIGEHLSAESVDCIVTEPFMGTTKLGEANEKVAANIKNILKGLEKLYIGSFREWKKILKPNARVVIAFPTVTINKREHTVKNIIDMCENLGYTKVLGPLPYSRPQAIVRREFFVFVNK